MQNCEINYVTWKENWGVLPKGKFKKKKGHAQVKKKGERRGVLHLLRYLSLFSVPNAFCNPLGGSFF